MLLVLNMSGFWIYHSFKYVRVIQGSKYTWICLNNSWICQILLNVPKFVWMAFVLHWSIEIPYLKNHRLSCWKVTIWFSFSIVTGSVWFCSLFLDWIVLQVRLQICYYLLETEGPGALNLTQSVRYSINISMMLF